MIGLVWLQFACKKEIVLVIAVLIFIFFEHARPLTPKIMEYLLYNFGSKFGQKTQDLWIKHGQTLRTVWGTKRGRVAIILSASTILGIIRAVNKSRK
jgi:hypothetical protein